MCILERIFMFQAIAKDAVKGGMGEEQNASEYQCGIGEQRAENVEASTKSTMVNQVINPGTEAGIYQVANHAQIGSQK